MDRDSFSGGALSGNVARLYAETARTHPDRLAIVMDDHRMTHDELRSRGERIAGGLHEREIGPGDRLALYVPNCPAFVVALLAGFCAGTPVVPLNPQLSPREVAGRLADSDARALVTHSSLVSDVAAAFERLDSSPLTVVVDDDRHPSYTTVDLDESVEIERLTDIDAEPLIIDRSDDDIALHPYTSGTTGEPKGVLLSHRNIRAQSLLGFDRTEIPSERERFLSPLPLAHIAGLINRTWQPLVRGGSVYLMDPDRWNPAHALERIESASVTKFGAVATMYVDLVEHDAFDEYDLSSLEEAMQGGAKLPTPVAEAFEDKTGIRPFEAYGLTETGGGTHVGLGSTFGHRVGTIGQPLRATDCKVVSTDGSEVAPDSPGELLVRGPHVMVGYHERPDETENVFTDHGYFRTGDIVRRDADNYYELLDRKTNVIVTSGYNVYPAEVEDVLCEHSSVADAAVVGIADERRNERAVAFVITSGSKAPTEVELRNHLDRRLARYKHPHEFEFVETFPRTASGKIKRFELIE